EFRRVLFRSGHWLLDPPALADHVLARPAARPGRPTRHAAAHLPHHFQTLSKKSQRTVSNYSPTSTGSRMRGASDSERSPPKDPGPGPLAVGCTRRSVHTSSQATLATTSAVR